MAIFITLGLIGYGGYRLYNYAIEVAIMRIRKGVTKGIMKGAGEVINPLKWPGLLFGKKHKKESEE